MRALALTVFLLASATPAFAQDTPPTAPASPAPDLGPDNSRLTVGIGAATLPDYDGADSNDITPAAVIVGKVKGHDFFTRGTQLYFNLVPNDGGVGTSFELGVIGGVRLDRTRRKGIDDRRVRALGSIDTPIEVGGYAGVTRTGVITSDYDTLTARIAVVQDVANAHDSYVITPQINYTTPLSIRNLVSIGASVDYVGKGYGRTYYSVTPVQTLVSGLRTYDIDDAGFRRVNLSLFGIQSLSGDLRRGWGVGAGVLYGKLLGKYKRSPIVRDVGDADQWSAAAGVTYTF